jgi:hypothetical protein
MNLKNVYSVVLSMICLSMVTNAAPQEVVYIPDGVESSEWMGQRRAEQLATRNQFDTFNDFTFEDTQPASGISFLHRIVDDAGKYYKAVHYDHGNGIAVADIDSDGLLDVYLVSQVGPNGLYRNMGGGQFEDITAQAGVAVTEPIGVAASFADIDNDGDPDLYVTNVRSPNRLYENNGDGSFNDISASSGLDFNEHSSGAVIFDYDRDGLLDVFLTVVGQYTTDQVAEVTGTVDGERVPDLTPTYYLGIEEIEGEVAPAFSGHLLPERWRQSRLFHNDGGNRFADVTEQVGLSDQGFSGDATATDFNNDGWPDLYVLNMQGHDGYWVNEGGERFVNQSEDVFPDTPWGAMGVKSFDYDNDGDMDMILSDMHSDMSLNLRAGPDEKRKAEWLVDEWGEALLQSEGRSVFGNAFFRNNGDGSFDEVSDEVNAENFWPWGLSVGDLNADGWQDVFIATSMSFPFRYQVNSVLINNADGRFMDAEYVLGVEPRRGGQLVKPWFKLDCSDVDREHQECEGRDSEFEIWGALGTRSSVIFDLDDDGDVDIITNEFGSVPQVLLSNLAEQRGDDLHYLKIRLVGTQSNRDGLGAKVVVTSGNRQWTQIHDGKSGYLSQSSIPLYFGLGDADTIDRIDVTWPSGIVISATGPIPINGELEVVEPRVELD